VASRSSGGDTRHIEVETEHGDPFRVLVGDAVTTTGDDMTETQEVEPLEADAISDAVALIDRGLADMMHRELVSTDEVANLLLDVRLLLTTDLSDLASVN
jgi:hypothetical protein